MANTAKLIKAAGDDKAANSFEVISREWFAKHSPTWVASHADKIIQRLERDIFPWLGKRPVADITAKELLAAVNRITDRCATETAHRALQNCGRVFRYAVITGHADRNPATNLRGALPPVKQSHHAAILEPGGIGGLLRAIDGYQGGFVTKCALRLAPLVFVRPGGYPFDPSRDMEALHSALREVVSETLESAMKQSHFSWMFLESMATRDVGSGFGASP